jgi:hypothetical protein
VRPAQENEEMRIALKMARNIREGHKVGWLIARRLKIKGRGTQLPCLPADGEGLGKKDWLQYAGEEGTGAEIQAAWRSEAEDEDAES